MLKCAGVKSRESGCLSQSEGGIKKAEVEISGCSEQLKTPGPVTGLRKHMNFLLWQSWMWSRQVNFGLLLACLIALEWRKKHINALLMLPVAAQCSSLNNHSSFYRFVVVAWVCLLWGLVATNADCKSVFSECVLVPVHTPCSLYSTVSSIRKWKVTKGCTVHLMQLFVQCYVNEKHLFFYSHICSLSVSSVFMFLSKIFCL